MRRILLLTLFLCLAMVSMAQREKIRLDDGWKFHFGHASDPALDFGCGTEYFNYLTKAASIHNTGPYAMTFNDSLWQDVHLPHDWVTALPYDREASHSHGYKTVGYKYPATSVGWYRTTITIPASDLGRHIAIQFDGIFRNAQVWCNGIFMGVEPSGYATQVYDITEYVNYGGENVICVRADATYEEGWFYEGGGIYRDVWLLKDALLHVASNGTFAYSTLADDFSEALLTVETTIENSSLETQTCTLRTTLCDADNTVIARGNEVTTTVNAKDKVTIKDITLSVSAPHLWDIDDPYLYNIYTEVVVDGEVIDRYPTRTGFRTVTFSADDGFSLNGRPVKLQGVNMHQDHAGVGVALPEALMRWRIQQLKSFGCNAYRASHNPMTPAQLDICDEEGILVIDENRLVGINDYHYRLLENFITRDRNHPCIILWSCGNEEWGLEHSITGTRIAEAMREMVRVLDPTRHSTIANAGGAELIKGLDVVGYNYIIQNDVYNRREAHPEWKIVGTEETTGCGTRGIYFNDESNLGAMASLNRIPVDSTWHVSYDAHANDHTPEAFSQGIERGWQFYATTPWAAGCFFWTGFDYRGEPNPLEYPAHDSQFGLLDYCGFYKDEAYYLLSSWTSEPTLHILPHWNLAGHEGEELDLWVYGNTDEVALTINGKSYGRQEIPKYGHATFHVTYTPGKVVATGYNAGKKVVTEVVTTTDKAAKVVAVADRSALTADGRDVAIVNISLVDKHNNVVPDACNNLTFSISGPGRILGAGNGDPACTVIDNPNDMYCQLFKFPAYNGHAQVLIQTTKEEGLITLVCQGDDLLTTSLMLTTDVPTE